MNLLITESTNAQMKDWRIHLVTRIDGNRIRLMESGPLSGPYAGQKNIIAGRQQMEGQKLIGSKSANRGRVNSAEGHQDNFSKVRAVG
jgi:hypothetical protein